MLLDARIRHWEQKLMRAATPFLDDRHVPPFQERMKLAKPHVVRGKCELPLPLLPIVTSEPIAKKVLVAMHLPSDAPEVFPTRGPTEEHRESRDEEE